MYPYQASLPRDHPEGLGHWLETCFNAKPGVSRAGCSRLAESAFWPEQQWLLTQLETPENLKMLSRNRVATAFFPAGEPVERLPYLRFDIHCLHCIVIQPLGINFHIKMANITHYGIILHLLKVPAEEKKWYQKLIHTVFSPSRCSNPQPWQVPSSLTALTNMRCVGL